MYFYYLYNLISNIIFNVMVGVSQVKVVKMDLKRLVEDMLYAYTSSDSDSLESLKWEFTEFYSEQESKVRESTLKFLLGYNQVRDNKLISSFFNTFLI